jgi:hypothetical protein
MLLTSMIAVPLYAGQDRESAYIEWKPVENTVNYSVEIADEFDEIILEKTAEVTKIEVTLPYGKYKYRVGNFNKFNKVTWSEWHTLMIVPALKPEIISADPAGLFTKVTDKITIKGKNFYRSSEVTIKNAQTKLDVKNVKLIDPETLQVTVDTKLATPGTYDLVVKNPGDLLDLKSVAANQFTVTPKPPGYPIEYQLGLGFGYFTPSLGIKDAYAGSLGFKFFCEFRSLGKSTKALAFLNKAPGLYPGVIFSCTGFLAPKPGFETSLMLQVGFYFGYEFSFPLKGDLKWHISPVIGYKQYFRGHKFSGDEFLGTKPIILVGGNFRFDLPMKFFIGLSLEYNAVFDMKPINVLGVFIQCGYKL